MDLEFSDSFGRENYVIFPSKTNQKNLDTSYKICHFPFYNNLNLLRENSV